MSKLIITNESLSNLTRLNHINRADKVLSKEYSSSVDSDSFKAVWLKKTAIQESVSDESSSTISYLKLFRIVASFCETMYPDRKFCVLKNKFDC